MFRTRHRNIETSQHPNIQTSKHTGPDSIGAAEAQRLQRLTQRLRCEILVRDAPVCMDLASADAPRIKIPNPQSDLETEMRDSYSRCNGVDGFG